MIASVPNRIVREAPFMHPSNRCQCGVIGCALGVANVKKRRNAKGHTGYKSPPKRKKDVMPRFLQNFDPQSASGDVSGPWGPPDDLTEYEALYEYLTTDTLDDGSSRQTLSLSIFWHDGRLKCSLNEREHSLVAFYVVESLSDLWDFLEAKLRANDVSWRQQVHSSPRKKTRRS